MIPRIVLLAVALLLPASGCALQAASQGVRARRDVAFPYHPNRRDYATFRAANPDLLEPNYLPFMLHRFARNTVAGDALILCRWSDDQMPIRVYVGPPEIAESLVDEFLPIAPERYVDAAKAALDVWSRALEGTVQFVVVESEQAAMLDLVLVGEEAPSPAPGKQRLGHTEALVDACRSLGWDADAERLRVRFELPELEIHLADRTGLLPPTIVRRLVIHELGHALGMRGHSPSPGDVMYAELSDAPGRDELSIQDVNSFLELYRLPNGTHYIDVPDDGLPAVPTPSRPLPPPAYEADLLAPYVDVRHGFEIAAPRGWLKIAEPHGLFFSDGPSWDYVASLRIFVWPSENIEDFLACCTRELLADSWLRRREPTTHKGRRALRISVEDAAGQTAEDLLLIEVEGDRVLLVVMARPVAWVSEWAPWFAGSLATLEIWDSE